MGMEKWNGKVALVTGASSGIGAATALRLAAAGMKVAVCARRAGRLQALCQEATNAGGVMESHPVDLRDSQAIVHLFESIRARWGGVDVLVNNAGLGHAAPLVSGDTEQWREMLEVNVLALSIATREAVADMRERGDDGHVVHVSSMAAHRVPTGSGVYSATKYAVRSLTEGLRQELRALGSAIRVTSISPGFTETEFAEHYHQSHEAALEAYGRFKVLDADDVAGAIEYALSAPKHAQIHDVLMRPTHQPS
ncbi:MAG: SDR family NAD(P)-dependent oxidoreductase [Deltaproteobacteria bacterium]|nr:SDR family NAD(P)-dependent oxidoreductase [Deltaproteobacteria bacterium]